MCDTLSESIPFHKIIYLYLGSNKYGHMITITVYDRMNILLKKCNNLIHLVLHNFMDI